MTREELLKIVSENGLALGYVGVGDGFEDDKGVALAAVQQNGKALCFCSWRLKNDTYVVRSAVQQDGWALSYASSDMQNNKDVVLAAVRNKPWSIMYASREMRSNKEIALSVALSSPEAYSFYEKYGIRNDESFKKEIAVLRKITNDYKSVDFSLNSEHLRHDLLLKLLMGEQKVSEKISVICEVLARPYVVTNLAAAMLSSMHDKSLIEQELGCNLSFNRTVILELLTEEGVRSLVKRQLLDYLDSDTLNVFQHCFMQRLQTDHALVNEVRELLCKNNARPGLFAGRVLLYQLKSLGCRGFLDLVVNLSSSKVPWLKELMLQSVKHSAAKIEYD